MADPTAMIKKQYDDQANAAQAAGEAAILAGTKTIGALRSELSQIEINRAAAIKAEQDKQKAANETVRQSGRNIDLAEARRIVGSIGGSAGSGARSYEEQKRLYDKYVAYKNGTGPWAALAAKPGTSNHELGQALDVAKTPGMSLKKLVDAFKAEGVRVTEYLDEGSHFHIAWAKVGAAAREQTEATREAARALAEKKRQEEAAVKAAVDYAAAQRQTADQTGISAKELRLYADAAAIAKAPTDALKQSIRDAAEAREKSIAAQSDKDFQTSVMQPLRDEIALYGLVGPARALAALDLEKQGFMAQQVGVDLTVATARWQEYYAAKKQLIDKDAAGEREAEAARQMAEAFNETIHIAQRAGDAFADAFGRGGAALADMVDVVAVYAAEQRKLDDQVAKGEITRAAAVRRSSSLQIGAYGDMISAGRGFFDEKSKGYKAVMAAEKVYRAFQFAMSIRSMVQDVAETISSVANSSARAVAQGAEGIATQSKLPFPFNIAAMAATGAALVAAGIAVLSSGGSGKSSLPQSNTGICR